MSDVRLVDDPPRNPGESMGYRRDTPGEEFYSMFFFRVPSKTDLVRRLSEDRTRDKEEEGRVSRHLGRPTHGRDSDKRVVTVPTV